MVTLAGHVLLCHAFERLYTRLNLPTLARQLRLGFSSLPHTDTPPSSDAALDNVLIATNDVLLVERVVIPASAPAAPARTPPRAAPSAPLASPAADDAATAATTSRIGVTWRDWRTIVGFVEGPEASVALQEQVSRGGGCEYDGGCCGAVKELKFPAATESRFWRWEVDTTFYGFGPTICYIGLEINGNVGRYFLFSVSFSFSLSLSFLFLFFVRFPASSSCGCWSARARVRELTCAIHITLM